MEKNMRRQLSFVGTATIALIGLNLMLQCATAKPASRPRTDPVQVTVEGFTSSGQARITSDGNGPYTNSDGGSAILQTGGNLGLDTGTRSLNIDFTDPAGSSASPPPFNLSVLQTPARLTSQLWFVSGGLRGLTFNNSPTQAAIAISFSYGGVSWQLQFDPNAAPGSNLTVANCTGVDSSGTPNQWTIETAPGADQAMLLSANVQGKPGLVARGMYHLPFKLTIEKV
jgi:hypothetical protein